MVVESGNRVLPNEEYNLIESIKNLNVFDDSVFSLPYDENLCHKLISTLVDALSEVNDNEDEKKYTKIFKEYLVYFKTEEPNNSNNKTHRFKLNYIWKFFDKIISILKGDGKVVMSDLVTDGITPIEHEQPRVGQDWGVETMFVASALNNNTLTGINSNFPTNNKSFFTWEYKSGGEENNNTPENVHLTQIPTKILEVLNNISVGEIYGTQGMEKQQQKILNINNLYSFLITVEEGIIQYNNYILKETTVLSGGNTLPQQLKKALEEQNNDKIAVFLKLTDRNNNGDNDAQTPFYYKNINNKFLEFKYEDKTYYESDSNCPNLRFGKFIDIIESNIIQNSVSVINTGKNIINRYKIENNQTLNKLINDLTSEDGGKIKFIFGYGVSGSGKTSTLIHLDDNNNISETEEANGIIPALLNIITDRIGPVKRGTAKLKELDEQNDTLFSLEINDCLLSENDSGIIYAQGGRPRFYLGDNLYRAFLIYIKDNLLCVELSYYLNGEWIHEKNDNEISNIVEEYISKYKKYTFVKKSYTIPERIASIKVEIHHGNVSVTINNLTVSTSKSFILNETVDDSTTNPPKIPDMVSGYISNGSLSKDEWKFIYNKVFDNPDGFILDKIRVEEIVEFREIGTSPFKLYSDIDNKVIPRKDIGFLEVENSEKKIKDILPYFIDDNGLESKRKVHFTPKNPKSSRHHVIAKISIKSTTANKKNYLYVGDFAGMENKFIDKDINTLYATYSNKYDFMKSKRDNDVDKQTNNDQSKLKMLEGEQKNIEDALKCDSETEMPIKKFIESIYKPIVDVLGKKQGDIFHAKDNHKFVISDFEEYNHNEIKNLFEKYVNNRKKFILIKSITDYTMNTGNWMGIGSFFYLSDSISITDYSWKMADYSSVCVLSNNRRNVIGFYINNTVTNFFTTTEHNKKDLITKINSFKAVTLKEVIVNKSDINYCNTIDPFILFYKKDTLNYYDSLDIGFGNLKTTYYSKKPDTLLEFISDECIKRKGINNKIIISSSFGPDGFKKIRFRIKEIINNDGLRFSPKLSSKSSKPAGRKGPAPSLEENKPNTLKARTVIALWEQKETIKEINKDGDAIRHHLAGLREDIVKLTTENSIVYPNIDTYCAQQDFRFFINDNGINEGKYNGEIFKYLLHDNQSETMKEIQLIIFGFLDTSKQEKEEKLTTDAKYKDINDIKKTIHGIRWREKFELIEEGDEEYKKLDGFLPPQNTNSINSTLGQKRKSLYDYVKRIDIDNSGTQLGVLEFLNGAITFFRKNQYCVFLNNKTQAS